MGHLKRKVTNKTCVKGSIVDAHIVEEMTNFMLLYFEDDVASRLNCPERYDYDRFV